jgi:hypothetical protein
LGANLPVGLTKQQEVCLKAEQSALFTPAGNPLEERLGTSFFEELPKTPGVYLMYGCSGRLLYVGKAKNLRSRLFTYRRVTSDNSSRKVRRLVRMAADIELRLCETEEAALLKENELIRSLKPEFNRAKKSPETYYFLTLKPLGSRLLFRLGMQLPEEKHLRAHTYGAFKGHRIIRKGTGAMLRQLYLLEHEVETPFEFPTMLMNKLTPLAYELPINSGKALENDFKSALKKFLAGRSPDFISQLVACIKKRDLFEEYIGRLILKDCESLKQLYDGCLHRNYTLKQKLDLAEPLIPQDKLDDYLIRAAFSD